MLDLFNKKALAEAQIKIANAEAKAEANSKKFKTAVIAGSSTTGAAVAAIAAHFVFGNGRKLNRDKIKNFDQVVEERDGAITEKAKVEAANKQLAEFKAAADTEIKQLKSTVDVMTASGFNLIEANEKAIEGDVAAWNNAVANHEKLAARIYKPKTNEDFAKLRNNLMKTFNDTINELEKAEEESTEEKAAEEESTEEKAAEEAKAEAIKNAEAVKNAACQKAADAKAAFDTAEAALNAVADPNNIPTDIQKAYDDTKAALDAAEEELKKAEEDLKALQNG